MMVMIQNWWINVSRRSYDDSQPLLSQATSKAILLGKLCIEMPVKKVALKRPAATLKRPAASQSGFPGDAAGWGAFQMVPYSEHSKNKGQKDFSHLSLKGDLKKAPALVKHIQAGSLHSSAGAQSVKDFLKKLDRAGDASWLQEWDGSSYADKRAIMERLKLQLDEKAVLSIKHTTRAGARTEHGVVRGWMALWEIADVEKIPFDPKYSSLLEDCVVDDESRPHSNPQLAKKGWREYYHVKNKATQEILYHDENHGASASVEPDDVDDFEAARQAITTSGLGRSSSASRPAIGGVGATTTTKSGRWKQQADDMVKKLSEAEVEATNYQSEIASAIDNGSNPALQKKHANLAGSWAKKLGQRKNFVLKLRSIATNSRDEVFDKQGNKFDEGLKGSEALIEEWHNDDNKELLSKLLTF